MIVAVSPYHLTTREPPAMAALLLAERIVTLAPAPESGGATSAKRAAGRSAAYARFMESWRWCAPLFEAGVIVSGVRGEDPAGDMREIARRISEDDAFAPLRPLMKDRIFGSETDYLGALSADVLKGGPDPAVTVPLMAGLDRFASRHGFLVARSEPISFAQRAEMRLAATLFATVVPVLQQATAERVLETRETLEEPIAQLREAIDGACSAGGAHSARGVNAAAMEYTQAFEEASAEISREAKHDDSRAVIGAAALSAVALPFDAVLRSSISAVERMAGRRAMNGTSGEGSSSLPVKVADGDGGRVISLVVRMIGTSVKRR